jgi:nitrite reductase (cytochrome c-552)
MMDSNSTRLPRRERLFYALAIVAVAAIAFVVMLLWQNISTRKEEARQVVFKIVELDENTVNPAEWGKNFPRQYDSYKRTVDTVRTKYGGSEAFSKLDADLRWRDLFKGYAFSVDYREERGHAFMLSDQDETERVKQFKQPGACLHCHASIIPAYAAKGREAGIPDSDRQAQIMKGFELVCAMPYAEARKLVDHPVACIDCHDPQSMQLRVTRPGFLNGIKAFARSGDYAEHLPSIVGWRKGNHATDYDPNRLATRQEMRAFVCGQCHVEYYFKGDAKYLTYPWFNGLKAEEIEAYYDSIGFKDWTHPVDSALMLKAQHPEFETWNQGIHARSGVVCADCHMPYVREGAVKVSSHNVRSPLLNTSASCQTCHRQNEKEMEARVETIQDRTAELMNRAEDAVLTLMSAIKKAADAGANPSQLAAARDFHRKAEWRLDFVAAENSMGFHASQETARVLGDAIDCALKGYVAVTTATSPTN